MADLETNRKIVTEIKKFDSLIVTKLNSAAKRRNLYDWYESLGEQKKLDMLPGLLKNIEPTRLIINKVYPEVIQNLKELIKNITDYSKECTELKKTASIYSDILKKVENVQKKTKEWIKEEIEHFEEFAECIKYFNPNNEKSVKNYDEAEEKIKKYKSDKVKELRGELEDEYNEKYYKVKESLKKAWGTDGYNFAIGEKTDWDLKFNNLKKECIEISKLSTEYVKWTENLTKEKPLEDEIKNISIASNKIQVGINDIIKYAKSKLLPGINLKNNDITALEKLKKMSMEIINWRTDIIEYLMNKKYYGRAKAPDIKKETLVDLIIELVNQISLKAYGYKLKLDVNAGVYKFYPCFV